MTTLREAAQQALEAMEYIHSETNEYEDKVMSEAITALRAALAQQAEPVEPVAWMFELARNFNLEGYGGWEKRITEYRPNTPEGSVRNVTPLYTSPPQRKPLTEEEIRDLWSWSITAEAERTATTQQHAFTRAIERAHGITDPQVADRLARHGIPMPEGDPK